MKRTISLLLGILMLLCSFEACADDRIKFTASAIETGGTQVFNSDAAYDALNAKFNFDIEVYPVTWDNWAQKSNMWIAGGEMPDTIFWNFNYIEYLNYVDQRLIKALPDGWEETYPNLAAMIDATGIGEYIKVDGKTYCVPHVTYCLFAPMKEAIWNKSLYVRKDWAEQVGMQIEAGQLITLDWLNEYITKVQAADLAGNGNTIGICGDAADVARIFMFFTGFDISSPFMKDGESYVWGPTKAGVTDGIKSIKNWYEGKLIDPDFYVSTKSDARNKFYANLAAVMIEDGTITNVSLRENEFNAANPGLNFTDCVANVALCGESGEWYGYSAGNYWAANLYSPSIDDQVFDVILKIQDYLCTKEGQELVNLGIAGTDFAKNDDGSYTILRAANEDGTYPSIRTVYPSLYFFYTFAELSDDFSFVDPTVNPSILNNTIKLFQNKSASTVRLPFDPYATLFSSDSKAQYSLKISDEVIREVVTEGIDIDTEWNNYIETNRGMWEPVVNDMNASIE